MFNSFRTKVCKIRKLSRWMLVQNFIFINRLCRWDADRRIGLDFFVATAESSVFGFPRKTEIRRSRPQRRCQYNHVHRLQHQEARLPKHENYFQVNLFKISQITNLFAEVIQTVFWRGNILDCYIYELKISRSITYFSKPHSVP